MAKKKTGDVVNANFRNNYYKSQSSLRSESYQSGGMPDRRNAFYNNEDPRRALEHADSRVVGNDYTAIASCPPDGKIGYFPGRPWFQNNDGK